MAGPSFLNPSPGGVRQSDLAAAKRAYRPASPVQHAISLAPQPRDQPGFQTPTVSQGGDLRSALVSSLTQASQSHSGDLTQALGLIQQMHAAAQAKAAQASAAPAIQPMGVGGPGGGSGGQSAPQGSGHVPPGRATGLIVALSRRYGVDPAAALAVASQEGLGGGIGDNNSSFGAWQLHRGGALPSNIGRLSSSQAQAWAWSPAGIEYAIRQISKVSRGLKGRAAIENIVRRFERPANPGREVAGATQAYGRYR